MYKQLVAVLLLAGATTSTGFSTEITSNFIGAVNQVEGDRSGVFNVSGNTPVFGSLTFRPADFAPDPVAPSDPAYLVYFSGGADSVSMQLSNVGGKATVSATSAFLLLCSQCTTPWSLLVSSDEFAFTLVLTSPSPISLTPGSSVFDLSSPLDAGATLSVLLSNAGSSLGFGVTEISISPEPATASLLVLASGAGVLIARKIRSVSARGRASTSAAG